MIIANHLENPHLFLSIHETLACYKYIPYIPVWGSATNYLSASLILYKLLLVAKIFLSLFGTNSKTKAKIAQTTNGPNWYRYLRAPGHPVV